VIAIGNYIGWKNNTTSILLHTISDFEIRVKADSGILESTQCLTKLDKLI